MQDRMNQHTEQFQKQEIFSNTNQSSNKGGGEDYIDFEEIKDN